MKFCWLKCLFRRHDKQHDKCMWPPVWEERHTAAFSPLTQRILAVNVMALAILVGSLLYLGRYQDRLIEAELNGLSMQARMSASAVAEGAVVLDHDESNILSPLLTRLMIRRLVEASKTRTRLYDMDDVLVADSLILFDPSGKVQAQDLPPPSSTSLFNAVAMSFFDVIDTVTGRKKFPTYPEENVQKGKQYNIVTKSREGELKTQVWSLPKGQLLLSAAAPVQRYKQVLGVVMLTRSDTKIKAAIQEVRHDILKIFVVTLLVTLLLSMYLARTIAQPLRVLAIAAERVRRGQTQKVGPDGSAQMFGEDSIPDFSQRQDEIGDLSVALREMTEALAKRIGAIENFAADVAHEIKNPLTSLRSAVETASRLTDPERQRRLMQVIQDDVDRLDRLITDISRASRLDAEMSRDAVAAIDVTCMLETLVGFYGQEAHSNVTSAEVVLDEGSQTGLFVSGVESRLVQVLQNLIMNALSFAPQRSKVVVGARYAENHAVEIYVEDEGPGIPEAKREAIFDRFYSERPKDEKFGTHSGLGLSISKQIIEAHHGRLWAENRTDEKGAIVGARFAMQMPIMSEA